MKLSKNFTLSELIKSQTAERYDIDNTPSKEVIDNLEQLAINVLQPVRDKFRKPVVISSGYRSLELNRRIGSKDSSQHTKGEAADFEIPGISNIKLAQWIEDNLEFDQLILEFFNPNEGPNSGWIHCSYREGKNRKEVLTAYKDGRYIRGLHGQ